MSFLSKIKWFFTSKKRKGDIARRRIELHKPFINAIKPLDLLREVQNPEINL